MNNDFVFASKVVELSEEKEYLTLKNRVFFFNSPNLNHVQLNYDDDSLEQCQTLVNMPLVAKYVKRNGKDDLGGHEVRVVKGEVQFGTQPIGVITDISIVEEEVETVTGDIVKLPCLYATERVWKRYKNYANAVRRLYSEGKLHNSWELKNSEYTFKDGIKYISKYTFLANCLLGSTAMPAYGNAASVVDMSQKTTEQFEYLAAEAFGEALALDMESMPASDINSMGKEETETMEVANENILENEVAEEEAVENITFEETAEVEKVVEESTEVQPEVSENSEGNNESEADGEGEEQEGEATENESSSMLTVDDVYRFIAKAVNELDNEDEWYWISYIFPEDHVVLVHSSKMNFLQFVQYNYRIEGKEAILENAQNVELTISPLHINSEIEKKNNAIAQANERIVELEMTVAELEEAKKELDAIKSEQEKAEHNKAVNALREYVENSGRFTKEELQSETVQNAINTLNESWLKAEIADRLVASLVKNKSVETSEVKENKTKTIILGEAEEKATSEDVMRAFFANN